MPPHHAAGVSSVGSVLGFVVASVGSVGSVGGSVGASLVGSVGASVSPLEGSRRMAFPSWSWWSGPSLAAACCRTWCPASPALWWWASWSTHPASCRCSPRWGWCLRWCPPAECGAAARGGGDVHGGDHITGIRIEGMRILLLIEIPLIRHDRVVIFHDAGGVHGVGLPVPHPAAITARRPSSSTLLLVQVERMSRSSSAVTSTLL